MIKKTILALLVLIPFTTRSEIIITPVHAKTEINKNSTEHIPFDITITTGYIYGNPVGKGIGKPTVIHAASGKNIRVEKIIIESPQKYYPENSPEWVYRYVRKARFFVTVQSTAQFNAEALSIKIDALECTDKSCTPVSASINYPLVFSPNASGAEESVPSGFIPIGDVTLDAKEIANGKVSIPYSFTPRTLDANAVSGLLLALIFGFLAGLILNFMPCVLPVVGLKLLSFIRASGDSRARLALTGLSYTAGVFLSFIVLSLLVYSGLSWGSLFQSRYFIAAMALIVFGMSLSLFGVFTLNVPFSIPTVVSSKNQFISAMYYGLIATLLATPCSGPFLGGTLAWTAAKGYQTIFPVFMSIAAGFSFPYILISLFPRLLRFLPKPGEWTNTLEKLLGFLLAGTAVYLSSIYIATYGSRLLWSLFIVAFALFIYGKWGSLENSFFRRLTSFAIAIILTLASFLFIARDTKLSEKRIEYAPFSISALEKYRNAGTVVIVDFTADWCPNCYFVENTVLGSDEVTGFIRGNGFVLMKGDITSSGTEAEILLNSLGSYSIPYCAVFVPGKAFTSPYTLRDIYTADQLLELLKKAKAEADGAAQSLPPVKVENFKF